MTIADPCVECIINQAARVGDAIGADATLKEHLVLHVKNASKSFDFESSPPEVASSIYEEMAQIAHKEDLYDEVKAASTQKALAFIPALKEELSQTSDPFLTAIKIAVAGNVIDLAAAVSFDLDAEMDKIFHTAFGINDVAQLKEKLSTAATLLYIGDNVGEHIFDYLTIETLQKLYPNLHVYYMVRGNPIINDVTMKEAKEAGFHTLCTLVDSGVNTPGFTYARANEASQKLFDEADVVITKGMGNYECLSPTHRSDLCYLLKVKCGVVAESLGQEIGNIVCKMI
jgi:uncharacterized protein with ATP-grasp and redox domains